jgi:hypothetical protein
MWQAAMEEVLDATKLAALHLIVAYTVYLHCALRGRARELPYLWGHRRTVRSAVSVSQIECDAEAYDARPAINNWRAQRAVQRRLNR